MSKYVVVVADGAKARFFTLEEAPVGEGGPNLVEHDDLVNPEGDAAGKDLYSEAKSGRNEAPGGGGAHGYDDHRGGHEGEIERRFAKLVMEASAGALKQHQCKRLVLVAEKRMLGHLRAAMDALSATGARVEEVAKDLTKLSVSELHAYLAKEGILPERQPAMM